MRILKSFLFSHVQYRIYIIYLRNITIRIIEQFLYRIPLTWQKDTKPHDDDKFERYNNVAYFFQLFATINYNYVFLERWQRKKKKKKIQIRSKINSS